MDDDGLHQAALVRVEHVDLSDKLQQPRHIVRLTATSTEPQDTFTVSTQPQRTTQLKLSDWLTVSPWWPAVKLQMHDRARLVCLQQHQQQ